MAPAVGHMLGCGIHEMQIIITAHNSSDGLPWNWIIQEEDLTEFVELGGVLVMGLEGSLHACLVHALSSCLDMR